MPYRIFAIVIALLGIAPTTSTAQDHPRLMVAWIENNNLIVWHTGDRSPIQYSSVNALEPHISPDGQFIAYSTPAPAGLWLITPAASAPVEIVPNTALAPTDAQYLHIGNLRWTSDNHLYFNTYIQPTRIIMQNNDLWVVDATTRTYSQILKPQDGGTFTPAPDGRHIAILRPGAYNAVDAAIDLVDQSGTNRRTLLNFPAVSTASDYDFIPPIFWQQDSTTINLAVPDKDLVYHDDTGLVALWNIGVDGTKTMRGTLQASFFGLPQWSNDGEHLAYLRHKGDISTNQFDLMLAAGDGSNPYVYASGAAGNLGTPQWIPATDQLIYQQGDAGTYWLGQPDHPPIPLPDAILYPLFVNQSTYVYATAAGDTFDLRYARLGGTASTTIATLHTSFPLLDARLIP